ncbi:MAG TPA: carnitine dehydratase [Rhodospirillaceae bacterium]|nr:carnitine dehydratase [Rhodospirillaceae bacterium]
MAPWFSTGYEYRPDIDRKTKTKPMPKDQTAPPPTPECLDQILRCVEWRGRPGDDVTFTGADPILPTNFRIGTAGAATLGAVGLAADAIHHLKTGRHQDIAVDHRAAAMAMRSNRHVRLDAADTGEVWADISGLYECGDGRWIQLHCNYPWLAQDILSVLDCAADRPSVDAALKTWKAQDFEDAGKEKNLCAFMVRSPEEWAAHPQAAAVASQPLMTIEKIGDAPAQPLPAGDRPLSGVRALELTRVLAGPVSGRTLAEHGAQVMRIGRADRPDGVNLVQDTGLGKLAADLDLREDADRDRLDALIRQSDVVTQGHRPGTLAARGLTPERLAALRPGVVFVSLSAWGHVGPWNWRRGFDSLVQCAMGATWENGDRTRPRHLPAQSYDYITGYLAAFGAMEGLRRRATEGGSWLIRLSLAQTGHWLNGLGRVGDETTKQGAEPTFDEVADLMESHDTVWGPMGHLKPVVQMSETPPRWDLPSVPLGTHPPVWPE